MTFIQTRYYVTKQATQTYFQTDILRGYMRLAVLYSIAFTLLFSPSGLNANDVGAQSDFDANDNQLTFDRSAYGGSVFPLWSPLSELEELSLANQEQAMQGNANALLALYIVASGTHRDINFYQQVNAKLDQLITDFEKQLKRKRRPSQQAELLYQAMHQQFFTNDKEGNTLGAYDADQSQLTHIFTRNEFNCISSSLLYLVLARKLDLLVEGVLLPSHAYVQLHDNNKLIEIETTSIYGFDVVHDENYYENTDQQWFIDRNLEPTTYRDYLNREIVSAFELGLHNMWSQHTSPERMNYSDRFRLAEIRSYLQDQNIGAQKNRLNFYLQELGHLNRQQNGADIPRLLDIVENYLETQRAYPWKDSDYTTLKIGVETEIAFAKINNGKLEQGFRLTKQLIDQLQADKTIDQRLLNNLYVVLSHFIQNSLQANGSIQGTAYADHYSQLRLSLIDLESGCIQNKACGHSFGQLYGQWAQQFWNQKDWRNASRILTEYLQFNIDNENTPAFKKNAELAYVNDAKQVLWDGDWEEALVQLESCVELLPFQTACGKEIKYIKEQRHLGNI